MRHKGLGHPERPDHHRIEHALPGLVIDVVDMLTFEIAYDPGIVDQYVDRYFANLSRGPID